MDTVESLKSYCQLNARICPQPQLWNKLWEMLPKKKRVGGGWEPALPLILAAWHDTPALLKRLRLEEHIHWADKTGSLDQVSAFLRGLKESDWHHLDE